MPGGAVKGRFFLKCFSLVSYNIGLAWHLLPIGSPFLRLEAATVRAVRTLKLGCTPMQLLGGTDVITRIRFEVIWSHKTSPKDDTIQHNYTKTATSSGFSIRITTKSSLIRPTWQNMLAKTAALWRGLWLINAWHMEVPEMGVPQIINFRFGISILNHSFWRSPIYEHPQVFWLFFSGILFHRHLQMLRTSTSTSSPTVHWFYVHDSSPVSWLQSWLDPENLRFGGEYLDPPKISPRKVWKF